MRKLFAALTVVAVFAGSAIAYAQISSGVPSPQPPVGAPANLLASGFGIKTVATGTNPLENPTGIYTTYGYLDDNTEALARTRTEPDQNTYLVTKSNPGGPTSHYDYGHHFLIQGHENGSGKAYLTRINLDIDEPSHRVTLLNDPLADGTTGLSSIDGSTYDPFNGQLLFTSEAGNAGHVITTSFRWSGTLGPAARVPRRLDGQSRIRGCRPRFPRQHLPGRGHRRIRGRRQRSRRTKVKQPNSFIYRFIPTHPYDLTHGKLQALQISDRRNADHVPRSGDRPCGRPRRRPGRTDPRPPLRRQAAMPSG